ncbi:unnamed protein product [Dibothriocephalus latus]|uniref:Exosome complex component CSL4 C-terminal domain-containing protein n=1 Tax=Dibothriocephalus latus TaxID=60516 RepID=A0A3P7NK55_DIBLA|nr:unnamed protein product [Dibothriocephalus latus]
MIRREDIRSTQRDRAEPSLSFRPGDLVRARVINLVGHVGGGYPSTSLPQTASPDLESIIGSARAVAAAVTSTIDSSSASSPTCLLSTAEPELGVVLGIGRPPLSGTSSIFGSTGGLPLVPSSWTEMVCPRSMAKFPRKVAKVGQLVVEIPEHDCEIASTHPSRRHSFINVFELRFGLDRSSAIGPEMALGTDEAQVATDPS